MQIQPFKSHSKLYFIMESLEYWFKKKKVFFKFMEPCSHRAYKKGDSWTEELGITRKTFNKKFEQIGTRYKSRTEFLEAEDKFKGKLYASYYDRYSNQIYFIRNNELVNEFLSNQKIKKDKKAKKPSLVPSVDRKIPQKIVQNESFRNGQNFRSNGGTIGGKIYLPTFTENNTTLQISSSNSKNAVLNPDQVAIAEEMKRIWVEEIEDFGDAMLLPCLTKNLWLAFKNFFQESWERWRAYCRAIASSKFLMGEGNNKTFKKIWIPWAIKFETIQKILEGAYGLGTRKISAKEAKKQEDLRLERQELLIEKQAIENTIEEIKYSVEKARRRKVNQHIESISGLEKQKLQVKFMQQLEETQDPLLKDCGDKLWESRWVIMRFERFMISELTESFFIQSLNDEVEEKLKLTNLNQMLMEVDEKLLTLEDKLNKKPIKAEKPSIIENVMQPHWI